jgi:hypothetical protein
MELGRDTTPLSELRANALAALAMLATVTIGSFIVMEILGLVK